MKFFVCCMIVLLNVSNNGKASLDSFVPARVNLLEDTTISSDKSCYRPCKFNVKPRRCHYHFKIEPNILEDGKPALTINGMTPGPPINVCVNDIVIVEVQNKVPDQDMAIHWHGMEQKGTPYMDGVPMVTQCPISYGSTYKYAFIASSSGTFFYHSDSVTHQSDGVYGSLVVNQPRHQEPHASSYDYDRSSEHTLLIAAKFPLLMTGNLELNRVQPTALIINGDIDSTKLFVMAGFAYRLRLVNAIAIECPIEVGVEKHEMMIISSDGRPVKAVSTKKVLLYPGERMDVVVRASQDNGGYWVEVRGVGACAGLRANAMFLYSGFNYTSMLSEGPEKKPHVELNSDSVYGQMLESLHDASLNKDVKGVYLGVDRNIVKFKESDNDFRYISDALPKKPFFPATLSLQESGVVQINGKSFLYPSAPLLLRPKEVRSEPKCIVGEEEEIKDPQCLQILNAIEGDVLEIALVNEGFGSNDSYTFHMHGYGMQVVATWQNPDKKPISKEQFQRRESEGKVVRNLLNPVIKDTLTVPNKGYTIVRMRLDHAGSWLLECRSCAYSSLPTAILINIPQSIPKSVTDSLPKCGNYKPPDVLLS